MDWFFDTAALDQILPLLPFLKRKITENGVIILCKSFNKNEIEIPINYFVFSNLWPDNQIINSFCLLLKFYLVSDVG